MKGNEAIQAIKARINIADYVRRYIDLRTIGPRLMAPCPFHQETKPSFSVNEDLGSFYCFGCQAAGDIFEFSMRINGYDFREALENFAEELGISLTQGKPTQEDRKRAQERNQKKSAIKIHQLAAKHFNTNLKRKEAQACNSYIQARGLSKEILEQFSLGYSLDAWQDLSMQISKSSYSEEDGIVSGMLSKGKSGRAYDRFRDRLMFPIYSLTGQVVAFGGRIIPDEFKTLDPAKAAEAEKREEAKYINSSDTLIYKKGEHLYGLYQARKAMSLKHLALLTEGYMDVLTLHQFGFDNAIGVLGTALTETQVKRISGFCNKVELLFDGDRAGRQAAFRSAQMLLISGLECNVVLFPEKEDIDSLLRQEDGLNHFASLRNKAEEGLQYLIRTKRNQSLLEAITWAKEFLQAVQVPEIISRYASTIANELGIDEAEIRHQVALKARQNKNSQKPNNGSSSAYSQANSAPAYNSNSGHTGQNKAISRSVNSHQAKDLQRDRLILTFSVRYPKSIAKLQELGADMILKSNFARHYFEVLSATPPDSVFNILNSEQKKFWIMSKEGDAPPCNDEEGEFFAIKKLVQEYMQQVQKKSVQAALRQGKPSLETQKEYLTALWEEVNAPLVTQKLEE